MTMTTLTQLEQRREALAKANETRTRRRELKRQIKAGSASFARVLVDPPEWLLGATVYEMLLKVPRIGPQTAKGALRRSDVLATTTFRSIMARQRQALLEELFRTPARKSL